ERLTNQEFLGKKKRMPLHIAESAELATALFWTAASLRSRALTKVLNAVNNGQAVPEDSGIYAADAIADYGHCLIHPVDINVTVENNGPALKAQIERVYPGAGETLQAFGLYTANSPEELASYDGILAMTVVA